jgi:hypothetical protein
MDKQFYIIKENRKVFIKLVEGLTIDQLNEIPDGFNNNIAWNFGHMVVGFQMITYMRTGKDMKVGKEYITKYQRGTKPETFIGAEEIAFFKEEAIRLIEEMESEWKNDEFTNFQSFTSSLGVTVNSCEDALHYAATHDMLHFGYSWALKRLVLNKSVIAQ